MTNEEIKGRYEFISEEITKQERELNLLRKLCPHEETKTILYTWRLGAEDEREQCIYCKEILSLKK